MIFVLCFLSLCPTRGSSVTLTHPGKQGQCSPPPSPTGRPPPVALEAERPTCLGYLPFTGHRQGEAPTTPRHYNPQPVFRTEAR